MQSIGLVKEDYRSEAESLAQSIAASTGKETRVEPLGSLAGPNDVVQWIGDHAFWLWMAKEGAAWLADKVASEVYEALKHRLMNKGVQVATDKSDVDFERLANDIRALIAKGGELQFRVLHEGQRTELRGTFIALPPSHDLGPEELAMLVVHLAADYHLFPRGQDGELIDMHLSWPVPKDGTQPLYVRLIYSQNQS